MKNLLRAITIALALGAGVQIVSKAVADEGPKSEKSDKSNKSEKGNKSGPKESKDGAEPGI